VPSKVQLTATREPDFAAIDRFVDSQRLAMRVPGLAIGIVHGDQIAHLAGFGQADRNARPVTPHGEGDESYGMGWVSGIVDGRRNVHHNGSLPTGYGDLRLLMEEGWGIVVLSNANSLVALPRLDGL